jgi:hypothetical protein
MVEVVAVNGAWWWWCMVHGSMLVVVVVNGELWCVFGMSREGM